MVKDPVGATRRESNIGAGGLSRGAGDTRWELADVVSFNAATHTSILRSHTGRPLYDVPQICPSHRDFTLYEPGQTVVVSYDLGYAAIVGVMRFPGLPQAAIAAPSLTGVDGVGADNPLQPTEGGNNYRPPGAPADLTAGDWARTGSLGNVVAVLEGGVTQMGSPTAMIRTLGAIGLLQTVAQRLVTVSDFGQWTVTNDQGRTSFILRAGANQSTQTGLDEQHWTIRLDLGATGDLLDFQITDPIGKTLFKLHVSADGRVQLYGDAGVDISSGSSGDNETLHDVAGDRTSTVGGADSVRVIGNREVRVGAALTENVTTDKTAAIGGDESRFVNADQTINVGGKRVDIVVGGPASEAKRGAVATETHVVNGGWLVDIGNPDDGANVSAQAAFTLRTSLGNVELNAGGGINLRARQNVDVSSDALITLGGSTYSLLLTETFLRDLGQFLTTLLAVLQVGTSGSSAAQTLTSLPGVQAQLQSFIQKVSAATVYASTKAKNG